jgi:hypothetical protein
MYKLHKIIISFSVLTLFAVINHTAHAALSITSDRAVVYCGDSATITVTDMNTEDYNKAYYRLEFNPPTGSPVYLNVKNASNGSTPNADGTTNATVWVAPNIQGFTCATSSNLSIPMGNATVKLQHYELGSGWYWVYRGNETTINFDPFGKLSQCGVTQVLPYTTGGGKIVVTGRTNYQYTAMNSQNNKTFNFTIPFTSSTAAGEYTNPNVTIPANYLVGGGVANTLNIIGNALGGNPGTIQCQTSIIIMTSQFSTNKDTPAGECTAEVPDGGNCDPIRLECNQAITFQASGLVSGGEYELRLVRSACGLPSGNCTTPVTTVLHNHLGGNSFNVSKSFMIGSTCTSGEPADPGNYKASLVLKNTGQEIAYRNLLLREDASNCTISEVITPVYVFSGGGNSGFKLTGEPGKEYRAYLAQVGQPNNNLPNFTTNSTGTANVTISNNLIRAGDNIIYVAKIEDTAVNCQAHILGKEDYVCSGPPSDICTQCPELNGQDQVCVQLPNGTYGCRADTENKCPLAPPEEACDLADPCGNSCDTGYECVATAATAGATCEWDWDNSCGERPKYDLLDGLTGNFGSFEDFLKAMQAILVPLGIILAVFFILTCGYKFMTSQGQPDKLRDAKDCLTSAIIGLLVVAMSVSILNTLINLAFKLL